MKFSSMSNQNVRIVFQSLSTCFGYLRAVGKISSCLDILYLLAECANSRGGYTELQAHLEKRQLHYSRILLSTIDGSRGSDERKKLESHRTLPAGMFASYSLARFRRVSDVTSPIVSRSRFLLLA